jgi:DNA-binding TFAR19-related protein (PDSD5 family)
MASWEDELAVLLRELGVTLEEPKTHLRPTQISEADHQQGEHPLLDKDNSKRQAQSADELIWENASHRSIDEDDDAWLSDLRMMRREVESIVIQVVRLMQRGDIDPAIKEDVLVVLRALRRRASVTQQAAASDAAYLEFAAAMLHFCRLVLRLSEVATEDY